MTLYRFLRCCWLSLLDLVFPPQDRPWDETDEKRESRWRREAIERRRRVWQR
jgi:hypothetical protein